MVATLRRFFLIFFPLLFLTPHLSFAASCYPAAGAGFSCSTPGTYTYNVGSYSTVNVTANGAGGGGGGGSSGTNGWSFGGGGGGGGAGAKVSGTYDVYPGYGITIYIGEGGLRGYAGDEYNIPVGIPGFPGMPSLVAGFLSAPYSITATGGAGGGAGQAAGYWCQNGSGKDMTSDYTRVVLYTLYAANAGGCRNLLPNCDDNCSAEFNLLYDSMWVNPASGAGGSIGGGHGYGPDGYGYGQGGTGGSSEFGSGGAGSWWWEGTGGGANGYDGATGGPGAGGGGGGSSGINPNDIATLPAAGGPGYVSITGGTPCSTSFNQVCTSTTNACEDVNYGVIRCDGSCSADGAPAERSYWNNVCTSYSNACGQTNTGTTDCYGTCSASAPANPANYGSFCTSSANSCGDVNYGYIQCNGACSVSSAPAERYYWNNACTLTSAANACGQTTTASGMTDCGWTCIGTTPAPPPVTTPNGNPYGGTCILTSSPNVCGQTTSASTGTYNCSGTCSGTPPASPSNTNCVYTVTVNTAGNGTGTVSGGGTYNWGSTATASALPNIDSTFTGWSGDCNANGQVYINGNKTCTATFADRPPTLGTVTISSSQVNPFNGSQYTITVSGSDTGGASKVVREYALINLQGEQNTNWDSAKGRGYLTWGADDDRDGARIP